MPNDPNISQWPSRKLNDPNISQFCSSKLNEPNISRWLSSKLNDQNISRWPSRKLNDLNISPRQQQKREEDREEDQEEETECGLGRRTYRHDQRLGQRIPSYQSYFILLQGQTIQRSQMSCDTKRPRLQTCPLELCSLGPLFRPSHGQQQPFHEGAE